MIKRIVMMAFAVTAFCANAVDVKDQAGLLSALSGADKNITITSSFKTSQDITIPAGYIVTLADGVTLTLGTYKGGVLNLSTYERKLKGEGTLVVGGKTVRTASEHFLPAISPTITGFNVDSLNGVKYDKTEVVTSGGVVSNTKSDSINCKISNGLIVDEDEDVVALDFQPKAVVCSIGEGINCKRRYVKAYASFKEAFNAVLNNTTYPNILSDKIVVLLEDDEFEVDSTNDKYNQKTVVIDCAGNSGNIKQYFKASLTDGGMKGEFGGDSFVTYLNASSANLPKMTNSNAAFINCKSASIAKINGDCTSHIYDCGSVDLKSYTTSNSGAYFYCGGPYDVTFENNYWAYGGTFTNEPEPMSGYEAIQKDGVWTVQRPADVVNLVYIGGTGYPTLQSAVNAAASGDEITLKFSLVLDESVLVAEDKDITVNLAGLNIEAANGAFINNGKLKLEDASGAQVESLIATAAGNLIENNGNLEITYGRYSGNILHNAGNLTVHNGEFNGELYVGNTATVNLLGGRFKNSVAQFLLDDFMEKSFNGYYYVGKFPYAIVSDATVSNTDKGWKIECLSSSDSALYLNSSGKKSDYANPADWYRRAEIKSMMKPYEDLTVDFVLKFNRAVKNDSISVTALGSTKSLDCDLSANEVYRVLSSNITGYQKRYTLFVSENPSGVTAGIKNNDVAVNGGTVCTVEMQLCQDSNEDDVLETVCVLASISYRFPWKDAVPELREDDSAETVAAALEGTADAKVVENIKDVASYSSYQKWTTGVKGATAAEVKASENAWLSYSLNTTNLVATPVEGDLKVESIAPSQDGAFALELSVKDIDIGTGNVDEATMKENLDRIFGIEGAASLDDSAFSTDNVVYTFGTPVGGKVTVEAKSAVDIDDCFFMRAKMNP